MGSATECTASVGAGQKIVGIVGMVIDVLRMMMIAVMDSTIDAETLFVGEWSSVDSIVPENL